MRFTVKKAQAGQRLDVAAHNAFSTLSRASVQKLLKLGKILVNKSPVKQSYKLKPKDKVVIEYKPQTIEQITLPILYKDKDCLVINKPSGLLTHSKGQFNPEPTVASFIGSYLTGLTGDRAGIVHRLDRPTSGVIICARNAESMKWLQKQFSGRRTKKTYRAVVSGELSPNEAIIDIPIERNPKKPQTFRANSNGKAAKTYYKVLAVFQKGGRTYSELELKPETGRTHQLRVHLAHLGHPIVGDIVYGGETNERLLLHAMSLELTLPNHKREVFTVALPEEFNKFFKK